MRTSGSPFRPARTWLVTALLTTAVPAAAQVGAIGAAPAGLSGTDEIMATAPILMESGYPLERGQVGLTALFGVTAGGLTLTDGVQTVDLDYTFNQLVLGAYYALSDRITLGLLAAPYLGIELEANGFSESDSGRGDIGVYGKGLLWRAGDGMTGLATFGSATLPVGEDGWGAEGPVLAGGLALSHRMERIALHGAAGVRHPLEEEDGSTAFTGSAGAVYSAGPRVAMSLEGLASTSDGETAFDVAPGARVRLGSSFYLSGAVLVNVSSSLDYKPYDYAVAIGGSFVR
jgi:hypothetical protein